MTNEEAIKNIWKIINMYGYAEFGEKQVEALEKAIKALEQEPVLDKIRDEFISLYPKNYAGEPEFGGMFCEFSLNKVLNVIDKYRIESEED